MPQRGGGLGREEPKPKRQALAVESESADSYTFVEDGESEPAEHDPALARPMDNHKVFGVDRHGWATRHIHRDGKF